MPGIKRTTRKIWGPDWEKNPDGTPREFVVIKKFSYGDKEKIQERSLALPPVNATSFDEENVEFKFQMRESRQAKLEIGITAWCILEEYTAEDGQVLTREVPFTPANIEALSPEYAEYIQKELEALNPERKSKEEAR